MSGVNAGLLGFSLPRPLPQSLPPPLPPPENSDDEDCPASSNPGSSSLSTAMANNRKQPAEAMGQVADQTARKMRLTLEGFVTLREYTEMPAPYQSVWLAASIISLGEQVNALIPAEAVYHVPSVLEGKIDMYGFLILVDPETSAYINKDSPVERLTAYLLMHPSWGLTTEVKSNKPKWKAIVKYMRDTFTSDHNHIKEAIGKSMGRDRDRTEEDNLTLPVGVAPPIRVDAVNIVVLCQRILAVSSKVAPEARVSTEMTARVAYMASLRSVYATQEKTLGPKAPNFWPALDNGLLEIREVKKDKVRISEVFAKALRQDMLTYGEVQLDRLIVVAPPMFE
ncbi:hypothetical protein C8J57DRAFT_1250186 [Mycena rebaudengoi]|nr:hypothetical protein C8J57DRAFT_1250186 [Mycena rebaudengoi]